MGLKEKRAIKNFQENNFETLKSELIDTLGFDVPVEVEWETLAKDGNVDLYDEAIPAIYFQPQIETFKDICQDDMGKEAMQEVLKKIVIKNENDIWSARDWAKFEDGILTLDHETTTNIGNVEDRVYYLKELIEGAL
ncbi:hypothetical protein [Aureivirga sp. CE67]|uniref:hypothetical protein n=1 Tax=Aureivirga sp. CE67 TaxID=1788983 RepID=UPI0018CB88A4|nr:hypothetical protein [Aureivirga sp. CE67]